MQPSLPVDAALQRLLQTFGEADGSVADEEEVELAFDVLLGDELVDVLVEDEDGRHCE